jgi:hypothetical protein
LGGPCFPSRLRRALIGAKIVIKVVKIVRIGAKIALVVSAKYAILDFMDPQHMLSLIQA